MALSTLAQSQVRPVGSPNGLRIAFVNVQWGDGIVIVGPTGTCMVFDGGPNGMGTQAMVPAMKKLGVSRIRYVVASHYHGDHIGGIDEVMNALPFDEVWDRGTRNTSGFAGSYTTYVNAAGSKRKTVSLGQVFDLGGGAKATVLAYDGNVLGSSTRHAIDSTSNYENSASIVVRVDYGDFSCWLGGDLTGGGSRYDMETPVSRVCGDVDVYLANHHGWDDGSNQNLLDTIDPEVCVISCSHKNTHNVPHRATLDRMSTTTKNRLVISTTPGAGEPGFTSGGTMLLATDGWRYTISSETGASVELYTDEFAGNTPTPGDLVISEFQREPSFFWGEYIEVFNRSGSPINLRGLVVRANNGSFEVAAPYRLLPRRSLLLAQHGDASRNGGLPFAHSWPARAVILHDDADNIEVAHGSKSLERVSYGSGFAGGLGKAAERVDVEIGAASNNFETATRTYGSKDYGTPGAANSVASPLAWPLRVGVERLDAATPGGGALHFFESTNRWTGKVIALGLSLGKTPGIPVGPTLIPLRADALFAIVDGAPGFVGVVPPEGLQAIRLPIPKNSGLTGLPAFCACYIYDPKGPPFVPEASDAVRFVFP
ncbi:MAG: MBL fold metallo-hydrolase [Planctomycetes bacterium]|nr:MBL fold metallo-hydrolase [Planctomycetota bacterium]MCB9891159.1 MBL fold metallo-hydrolase [Planctomycetota bacterium]MCB9918926.1 MBL fold metallo-hydrolase [Planctomycetota bacterium]